MSEPDMKLPPGKTCADCSHFKRCKWLISCEGTETVCDWSPSRFRETVAFGRPAGMKTGDKR